MPTKQELLAAALDPDFYKELGGNFRDTMARGLVASNLGLPVDMYQDTVGMLGGKPNEMATGGSEWIGKQMQDAGFIGGYRNPTTETMASIAAPAFLAKGGSAVLRRLIK